MSSKIIPDETMEKRKKWLQELGGLSRISVKNKEWLTLFEEDVRHSLMIEGEFFGKLDLSEVLEKGGYEKHKEILGYFEAASSAYELAFQQYKENEFFINKSLIRQIHSLMFKNIPLPKHFPLSGEWRPAPMKIIGAKVSPPPPEKIQKYLEKIIAFINTDTHLSPSKKATYMHAFFEYIHPFPDGNGRVGRILMNFILIAHGLPNIAIKGFESEKKKYFSALETADTAIHQFFSRKISLQKTLKKNFQELENLIEKNLSIALDHIICTRFSEKNTMIPVRDLARNLGKDPQVFSVACSQKKYISSKIKGKVVSHQNLI